MRSATAPELAVLASPTRQYTPRVKVANGSGTMIDLTSWTARVDFDHDIDEPVSGGTVYFIRADGSSKSLSPLRSDSTLNRLDDGVTVSAQLDVGRRITVEVATTAMGISPSAGDYKLLVDAVIDIVNFEDDPVSAAFRDKGGLLVDRWVGAGYPAYQTYTVYGRTPGTGTVSCALGAATFSTSQAGKLANGYTITVGTKDYTVSSFDGTTHCNLGGLTSFGASAFTINAKAIETVMQEILDAWVGPGVLITGTSVPTTLNVPTSPSFLVTAFKQLNMRVMEALQALTSIIAWDVRYKWDNASSSFLLTLFQPDRTKTIPDFTFGPSQYFKVSRLNVDRTNVRNFITIKYFRPGLTPGTRTLQFIGDSASITRYGLRYMEIEEPEDSPINSDTEALNVINAILSDLKDPKAEQEIELDFFWPAELGDLYRHSANGVHYNADQDYAVVRIEHSLESGSYRTTLKTRGSPAGAHINHFPDGKKAGGVFWLPRIITTTGQTLFDAETGSLGTGSPVTDSRGFDLATHFNTAHHTLDDAADGPTYAKMLGSRLSSGALKRSGALDDAGFALYATENNGTTKTSSALNPQGSILPASTDSTPFSYTSRGPSNGNMSVSWTWPTILIYLADGTTITIPASSALATPPSPTLSQVAAGALAGRTRFVRIAYVKNTLMYHIGAEASLAISANNLLKVTSPPAIAGYDGWIPLVGTASNAEFFQPIAAVAFGTDWTEPTTGADFTVTPYDNATMPNAVTATARNVSSTYYFYPFWDVVAGLVAFPDNGTTAKSGATAIKQNMDGRIGLTAFTGMSAITPPAAGSGSGAGVNGGGKFL